MTRNYSVAEVAARFRRDPRTIRDWINKGCPTAGGQKVKLGAGRFGKSWEVSSEDLEIFELRVRRRPGSADIEL
jgi:transposase